MRSLFAAIAVFSAFIAAFFVAMAEMRASVVVTKNNKGISAKIFIGE